MDGAAEDIARAALERAERAKRRFDESWLNRDADPAAVEQDLDELDTAVGLWLDLSSLSRETRLGVSPRESRLGVPPR